MNIRWTQPTLSGLADRLTDILALAAYARVRRAKLHINWPPFTAKAIDTSHRRTDILLENVLKFVVFPPEVIFNRSDAVDEDFNHYMGGGFNSDQFHAAHLKGICTIEEYKAAVAAVAKDFGFCESINTFLQTLPEKFVSFHIRRGDKVRSEPHDGCFIQTSELDWLNKATYRALDYYISAGYNAFFVCGDEDEKTQPFVDYACATKGKTVIKIPAMPKWEATYYDMAVMTKSVHNVASQRFSSFSLFPALIGHGSYTTVFGLNALGLI